MCMFIVLISRYCVGTKHTEMWLELYKLIHMTITQDQGNFKMNKKNIPLYSHSFIQISHF